MTTSLIQTLVESSPKLCTKGEIVIGHTPPTPGYTRGTSLSISYNPEDCPVFVNYYKITDEKTKQPIGFVWNDKQSTLVALTENDLMAFKLIKQQITSINRNLKFQEITMPIENLNYLLFLLLQNLSIDNAIAIAQKSNATLQWKKIAAKKRVELESQGIDIDLAVTPIIPEFKTIGRHSLDCPWLQNLEMEKDCTESVEENYFLLNQYNDIILSKLIQDTAGSCYYGNISIAVDQAKKKAAIYDIELTPCIGEKKIILLHLEFGDFDFNGRLNIKQQVKLQHSDVPGHAMGLILDDDLKTGELFEPNSPTVWWVEPVRQSLIQWANGKYKSIDSPRLFCPNVNIQTKIGKGVCLALAMLYLAIRVHCPSIPREDILKGLSEAGRDYLNSLLEKFLCKTKSLI